MEYGNYIVYVFFLLLMVFWGRRIGQSERPFLTRLLIISGLFVFFALGGSRWQELWVLLWPQWALAFGFALGVFPLWFSAIPVSNRDRNRKRAEKYRRDAHAEIERQKQAAEDDLRRQQREASERLKLEKQAAEETLRKEAERLKREADEKIKQAQDYARQQQRQAQAEKASSAPDPYEVLGIKREATQQEIKSAYRKLAAQYHPDKAANATDEIKNLAEAKFRAIKNAFDHII